MIDTRTRRRSFNFQIAIHTALIVTLLLGDLAIAESTALDSGMAAYQSGDFKKASYLLSDERNPELGRNATALYYRANALVKIGRIPRALDTYRKAKALNQDPQINRFCEQAINSLSSSNSDASPAVASVRPCMKLATLMILLSKITQTRNSIVALLTKM
jgi:tetratricopeptide (TPR) repeat protein